MAVAALFFVNGMTFSNWLPRIPEVRDRLGLDNAGLGATLIGGGLGGLVGSLVVGRVIDRFGTRRTLVTAATGLALVLPLIAVAPSAVMLAAVLTTLGLLDVNNDMAMNAQGAMVERRIGRSIVNRLHGMWSMGFTLGTMLGLLASAADIGVGLHLTIIAVVMLITIAVFGRRLLREDEPVRPADEASSSRSRSGVLMALAFMAIGISFIEIVPNDWGAVVFRDLFDTGRWSGGANVGFAGSMLIGRMGGDYVLDRIGRERLLRVALGLSAIGAATVVLAPVAVIALIGFALWGLGVSVLFPQLYAIAANVPGVSVGAGLGAMGVGQRLGFMVAPVLVGPLAQVASLRLAIAAVTFAAVAGVVVTQRFARAGSVS